MNDALDAVAAWVTEGGLAGVSEPSLLRGFCERCGAAGLPVSRALVLIDTLHPVYEGRAFRWTADDSADTPPLEYGRTTDGTAAENWRNSIFFHMLDTGRDEVLYRFGRDGVTYSQLDDTRREGHSELVALVHRFAQTGVIGEMDCVYSYWCTRSPSGFTPAHLQALRRLLPSLALAIKAISLTRIARTLVETYLGRDAGRRVLSGRILRGVAEPINAVLWFSDLRDFTRITDRVEAEVIIPLLNDYADVVISAVHSAGGDVLKLIGDGVLAIFTAPTPQEACGCALAAEVELRKRVTALNERRFADQVPTTEVYLGLHIGDVWYGNVGSLDRLDFTVVGRAVNEAARIAALCRSADKDVLVSEEFRAAAADARRGDLVSVGRYALRGVVRPRELFTVDRTEVPP